MKPIHLAALGAGLLFTTPAAALGPEASHQPAVVLAGDSHSHNHGDKAPGAAVLGDLHIEGAVARASIGVAPNSAAYMTIKTMGAADRLIRAASPAAETVELHTTVMQDGVMKMMTVDGIEVAPDAPAELAPGGLHVMLIGLVAPLKEGTTIPVTLVFEKAGEITLDVPVSKDVKGGHGGHTH